MSLERPPEERPKTSGTAAPCVRKPKARARVSNGGSILPNVDQRSYIARRFRDIVAAIAVDQGGPERLSEARLQLIRRFSAASVLAEQMEARLARGEQINIAEHALLCSSLVRLVQRIGINRRAKEVLPSLREYIEKKGEDDDVREVDLG